MGERKVSLRDKWEKIPVTKEGDPNFTSTKELLTVFTREEIVVMVNRWLYAQKYQREHHAKKAALQGEEERLLKLKTPASAFRNIGVHKELALEILEAQTTEREAMEAFIEREKTRLRIEESKENNHFKNVITGEEPEVR
jgi:hypothetical protein